MNLRSSHAPELSVFVLGVAVLLFLSDSVDDLVVVGLLLTPFLLLGGMYLFGTAMERRG